MIGGDSYGCHDFPGSCGEERESLANELNGFYLLFAVCDVEEKDFLVAQDGQIDILLMLLCQLLNHRMRIVYDRCRPQQLSREFERSYAQVVRASFDITFGNPE